MIQEIKNHINDMFDQTIMEMAVNDQISLEEFQLKIDVLESARSSAMDMIDLLDPFSNHFL